MKKPDTPFGVFLIVAALLAPCLFFGILITVIGYLFSAPGFTGGPLFWVGCAILATCGLTFAYLFVKTYRDKAVGSKRLRGFRTVLLTAVFLLTPVFLFRENLKSARQGQQKAHENLETIHSNYVTVGGFSIHWNKDNPWGLVLSLKINIQKEGFYLFRYDFDRPVGTLFSQNHRTPKEFDSKWLVLSPGVQTVQVPVNLIRLQSNLTSPDLTLQKISVLYSKNRAPARQSAVQDWMLVYRWESILLLRNFDPGKLAANGPTFTAEMPSEALYQPKGYAFQFGPRGGDPAETPSPWVQKLCENRIRDLSTSAFQGIDYNGQRVFISDKLFVVDTVGWVAVVLDAPADYTGVIKLIGKDSSEVDGQEVVARSCNSRVKLVSFSVPPDSNPQQYSLLVHPNARLSVELQNL